MSGLVSFVGAGPGAADLLTLRAAQRIAEADIVIWAASLVHEDVLQHARPDAVVVNSRVAPGDLPGIGLEGKAEFYKVLSALHH